MLFADWPVAFEMLRNILFVSKFIEIVKQITKNKDKLIDLSIFPS